MKDCVLCGKSFVPQTQFSDPAQIAGQLLSEEYGDQGRLCPDCLASRGRLAMMYRTDCFD